LFAAEAACRRKDPAQPRAGDNDKAATPVTISPTDSLLLLEDGTGEFGSNFIDNLNIETFKYIRTINIFQSYIVEIFE
jgi:hypothetical protein